MKKVTITGVIGQDGAYLEMGSMFASWSTICWVSGCPSTSFVAAARVFSQWLEVVTESDGAVCISNSVAVDLGCWHATHPAYRQRPFKIDWFHIGADIDQSRPSRGLPDSAESLFKELALRPSFLMVGTIEPRKGHAQFLLAFEHLWTTNTDVNLVVAGKEDWLVDDLTQRLRKHSEFGKRFFWLEGISGEYLEIVHATSIRLIAASYGEGFGLSLIEAAQHGSPIIARGIPVFREVAGTNAYYFDATTSGGLAHAISAWLELYQDAYYPKLDGLSWMRWSESAGRRLSTLQSCAPANSI